MALVDHGGEGSGVRVPGLYAALLERERERQYRHDRFVEQHPQYRDARSRRLLDALEAGQPAVLQGRNLRGWGIPKVPLRREHSFDWFAVARDDTVTPAESPEDPENERDVERDSQNP